MSGGSGTTTGGITCYTNSYAANLNITRTDNGSATDPHLGQSLAAQAAPAKSVMLVEVQGIHAPLTDASETTADNVVSAVTNGGNGDLALYPFASNPTATGGDVMTGPLGGRPKADAKTPRHFDGANYLMIDGHVKWFRGASVSAGSVALAESCNQNGTPALADCAANAGMAAGTGNSNFAVTFSTR